MISILAMVLLAFGLTACGNAASQTSNDKAQTESSQEVEAGNNIEEETAQDVTDEFDANISDVAEEDTTSEKADSTQEDGGVLVVYFSATGTTQA